MPKPHSSDAAVSTEALVQRIEQNERQIDDLKQSNSWRMTLPLRWVGDAVRNLKMIPSSVQRQATPILKDYAQWTHLYESLTTEASANLIEQIQGFAHLPLFSILLPVNTAKLDDLKASLNSVSQQLYPNWELCVSFGPETSAEVQALLHDYAQSETRIKVKAGHTADMARLCNLALEMVSVDSDWVFSAQGILNITAQAMVIMARCINEHENSLVIYADEDVRDAQGHRARPDFKPDWNLDLHLSRNLIGRFGVYRTTLVRQVGGYQTGLAEAMDFDLSLRCLEHATSDQIVHLPYILFQGTPSEPGSPVANDLGVKALSSHFERQHIAATAENIVHGYRIHYALPKVLPLVSLIIPTRNGLNMIRQCVESIRQKTSYPNYEIIIVDNGSDDAATMAYFEHLAASPQMRILRVDEPFNYSALNNAAVKVAKGELIGLINNDIEVVTPGWLNEMASHALRPHVGAVGARLWFPDDTLQHGGVVLGVHGWAAHAHNRLPRGSLGYHGRMALVSEFSAVTGACLLVRKSSYEAVGGLNEEALKISCNDVDFCLKLKKIGLRSVWTPFADLYHHESASRGLEDTPAKKARFACELSYMQQHWGEELNNDRAYSPNLTLDAQDFGLAWPPRAPVITRDVIIQPGEAPLYERLIRLAKGTRRVAYFAENVHSSTFRYRAANMVAVLNAVASAGDVSVSAACFFSNDLQHADHIVNRADILVISRARYDSDLAALAQKFQIQGKRVLFDIDDLVFDTTHIDLIISTSGQKPTDDVLNYWFSVVGRMAQALMLCDGAITTNDFLALKVKQFSKLPVKIIPNFANAAQLAVSKPLYQSKLTTGSAQRERIKLGYFSGSSSHNGDLLLIAHALERVMAADARVDLVLVGHVDVEQAFGARFGGYLNGHLADRVTIHPFVDFLALQALIADVDFNLVPLQVNEFTHCKSELKFVDAAIVGTLTIASPTFAYAEAIRHGENGYLAENDRWEAVLQQAIATRDGDLEKHMRMTAAAYQDVQQQFTWQTQRASILQALEVS